MKIIDISGAGSERTRIDDSLTFDNNDSLTFDKTDTAFGSADSV